MTLLPLDGQKSVNLRDERHQLIRVLFVRSKFAKLHPLLFLLGNHRALLVGRTFNEALARTVPKLHC